MHKGQNFGELKSFIGSTINDAIKKASTTPDTDQPQLMTRKEVAAFLGVSLVTLNELTRSGKIRGYHIGSLVRYKRHEVEDALLLITPKS